MSLERFIYARPRGHFLVLDSRVPHATLSRVDPVLFVDLWRCTKCRLQWKGPADGPAPLTHAHCKGKN